MGCLDNMLPGTYDVVDDQHGRTPPESKPMPKPKPKIRVIDADPRRFAENLDALMRLVGHSRKEAAEAIGVTYKLIRRYVSAGMSRPDYRSQDSLERIAAYFALPNIRSLWREDLVESLLTTEDGRIFVGKFRSELEKRLEEERSRSGDIDKQRLEWLKLALGEIIRLKPSRPPMSHLNKAGAILQSDSPKTQALRVMIDLLYDDLELGRTGTC